MAEDGKASIISPLAVLLLSPLLVAIGTVGWRYVDAVIADNDRRFAACETDRRELREDLAALVDRFEAFREPGDRWTNRDGMENRSISRRNAEKLSDLRERIAVLESDVESLKGTLPQWWESPAVHDQKHGHE